MPKVCTVWCKACNPLCKLSSEFVMTTWSSANNMVLILCHLIFYSCSVFFIPVFDDLIYIYIITLVIKGSPV
jgi:hypothetical protein